MDGQPVGTATHPASAAISVDDEFLLLVPSWAAVVVGVSSPSGVKRPDVISLLETATVGLFVSRRRSDETATDGAESVGVAAAGNELPATPFALPRFFRRPVSEVVALPGTVPCVTVVFGADFDSAGAAFDGVAVNLEHSAPLFAEESVAASGTSQRLVGDANSAINALASEGSFC